MRCNTPEMRKCDQSTCHGGTMRNAHPMSINKIVRRTTLRAVSRLHRYPNFENEKAIDTPMMKRKKGNTRSVGVHPCHSAWRKGA